MFSKAEKKLNFCDVIFLIATTLVGGFNEHISCLLSCALLVYLFVKYTSKKELCYSHSLFAVSVTVICLAYGLTCFWAIDSGMAFIGFLKFLPILLYFVAMQQSEKKIGVLNFIPYFAAVLVIVSAIGAQIPGVKSLFLIAGRFAGVFQYPNTFALFLLICELLLLKKFKFRIFDCISMIILAGGVFYTGSRTVFVLFFLANFVLLLALVKKSVRIAIIISSVVAAFALVGLLYVFRDNPIASRYLNMDFGASTFVGRLLYFVDALPLIFKYPFGMGYMGYYYVQHTVQTGVYNVIYAHNDFLQLFLDVGIIPAALFIAAVGKYFFDKKVRLAQKIIVATFCLHTLFDFNLQYIAMFWFLIILMSEGEAKSEKEETKPKSKKKSVPDDIRVIKKSVVVKPLMIVLFVVNLYMAVALALAYYNVNDPAFAMYPYNTRCNLVILEQEEDLQEANELADHIIKQNDNYFAPYSVKSKYAYSKGDFVGVINNKHEVFARYPFRYTEYKEYCTMLINGAIAFAEQGDVKSANICNDEVIATAERLASNKDRLSKLGKMIDEQPVLRISKNILEYIDKLKEEQVTDN